MGKTLSRLKRELGCQVLTSGLVKKNMDYFPTPNGEKWQLGVTEELLDVKSNKMTIENFSHIDVQNMHHMISYGGFFLWGLQFSPTYQPYNIILLVISTYVPYTL